ncbi:MAG TPA: hypothetical protein GX711_03390, partial [Clostridia bacterium]|nr:hypothetical protein [Clostridia bacterium]
MKFTKLLIIGLLVIVLVSGCGSIPEAPEGLLNYPEAGIDPDTWVIIPAGEFF